MLTIKFLIACVIIVAVKFFTNMSKYYQAKRLRSKYHASFYEDGEPFDEYIPLAKKFCEDTGLNHISIPVLQPLGYSQFASFTANVSANLSNRRSDMVEAAMSLFDEMVGVYRMRMRESLSLQFWVDAIIFLPKHIVKYLNGNPENLFTKLGQLLYWIAAPLLLIFRSELYQFLIKLLEQA